MWGEASHYFITYLGILVAPVSNSITLPSLYLRTAITA